MQMVDNVGYPRISVRRNETGLGRKRDQSFAENQKDKEEDWRLREDMQLPVEDYFEQDSLVSDIQFQRDSSVGSGKGFYAVARGRVVGIFTNWKETQASTELDTRASLIWRTRWLGWNTSCKMRAMQPDWI
jgi:hypothetical protein